MSDGICGGADAAGVVSAGLLQRRRSMTSHFIIRDDVRQHGSGNAGLTNFYRTYGARYALVRHRLRHGENRSGLPHRRIPDALGWWATGPWAC